MNIKLMGVNIHQFDEGDEDFSQYIGEGGELDVDSLVNDYNKSQESETPDVPDNENQEETTPEPEEPTEPEDTEEVEGDPKSDKPDETKQDEPEKRTPDQAFAEMRRKAETNEKFAKWVQKLAEKQGFQSPDALIEEFEKQQLAKEAEAKGIPVDVYERLSQLEKENAKKDEQMFRATFNQQVENTKEKYNLNEDQVTEVFRYMGQNKYIDPQTGKTSISFEDAYTLANRDTLIKEAEERGRQAYLEQQKQKQSQATPNAGSSSQDKGAGELDFSEDAILKNLEKMEIAID